MPPRLCSICRTSFDGGAPLLEGRGNQPGLYWIHRNYQSFANSYQSKCRVCYDLWTKLAAWIEIPVEELSESGLVVTLNVTNFPGKNGKPRYIFWMYSFYVKESASPRTVLENKYILKNVPKPLRFALGDEWYQFICSRIFVLTETIALEDSRSLGAIGSSSKSPQTREVVNKWVHSCVDNHPECRPWRDMRSDVQYPARILDVGERGSAMVHLRVLDEEDGFDESYNTLSYCRGSFDPPELTKTTFNQLVTGTLARSLPKTFRNAVALTRQVGVRYLWIDSLCVFQDSEEDRRIEGGKSGDIYGNGLLNILATGADDCDGGLFFDREAITVQPLQVKISWPIYQEALPHFKPSPSLPSTLYDCSGMGDWNQAVDHNVANKRAWLLQERLLSCRNLYCCREQMYWACKRGKGNESFPNGIGTASEGDLIRVEGILDRIATEGSWKMSNAGDMEFQHPSDQGLMQNAYKEWIRLIERYTACGLTRDDDIFLAFSGIAKRFETLLGDRYISGLLVGDLRANLLWFTKDVSVVRLTAGGTEETWRAPTWSWAAVKGKVEWESVSLAPPRYTDEVLEGSFLEFLGDEIIPPNPDKGSKPSRIRLKVKAFWLPLIAYLQRLPPQDAVDVLGVHARMITIRTSPARCHYGFGQFDGPDAIALVSRDNGLDMTSVSSLPVRWSLERTPSNLSSEGRTLIVTGLLVSWVKGYPESLNYLHRVGLFTLKVPSIDGNEDAQRELLDRLQRSYNSESFKQFVLV